MFRSFYRYSITFCLEPKCKSSVPRRQVVPSKFTRQKSYPGARLILAPASGLPWLPPLENTALNEMLGWYNAPSPLIILPRVSGVKLRVPWVQTISNFSNVLQKNFSSTVLNGGWCKFRRNCARIILWTNLCLELWKCVAWDADTDDVLANLTLRNC